ncbi:guanylate kinase [Spongiactinospora rosea]|uniref:Guanylate kinase n=1 Tax=Spongiactinospora rosea TaxID=2248750 RepID=A0A366M574_9ACTN|nr:AAA family ATPase [Spongiactinospora rosea]RBQ21366.1 guanylate kinase [Spongiactinospora rosea]
MKATGIILCGPPASGKSTITRALHDLDPRFVPVRNLVVGPHPADDHDQVTDEQVERLRRAGRIISDIRREGGRYAIDRHPIEHMTQAGLVPVIHVCGRPDVRRLSALGEWVRVLLWAPREVCHERLRRRDGCGTGGPVGTSAGPDVLDALQATADDPLFHLRIATDETSPDRAAREIADAFTAVTRPAKAVRPQSRTAGSVAGP